jgi:hypothetical protein
MGVIRYYKRFIINSDDLISNGKVPNFTGYYGAVLITDVKIFMIQAPRL